MKGLVQQLEIIWLLNYSSRILNQCADEVIDSSLVNPGMVKYSGAG
jgi:hypothetical protein